MMVISAVTSHAAINNAGDPSTRLISAGTIKMPDPIIAPITIADAENRSIPSTTCGAEAVRPFVGEEDCCGITSPNLIANAKQSATRTFQVASASALGTY